MTRFKDSAGRVVVDVSLDWNSDGSGFFTRAVYLDDGKEVSETELERLDSVYPEYIDEQAYERQIGAAEAWADRDR